MARPPEQLVWRLGHRSGPWDHPPRAVRRYIGRFDDPEGAFGTLYVGESRRVCFQERLAPLRLTPAQRTGGASRPVFGITERQTSVLVAGRIRPTDDDYVDLSSSAQRAAVEQRHGDLLDRFGVEHLDLTDTSMRAREFTQAVARQLYDDGAAGVRYSSNVGDGLCWALFEGRAMLAPVGARQELTTDVPELVETCEALGLDLARL